LRFGRNILSETGYTEKQVAHDVAGFNAGLRCVTKVVYPGCPAQAFLSKKNWVERMGMSVCNLGLVRQTGRPSKKEPSFWTARINGTGKPVPSKEDRGAKDGRVPFVSSVTAVSTGFKNHDYVCCYKLYIEANIALFEFISHLQAKRTW
jgi:hypothetical protein